MSGGGARGAYEVGVLGYLYGEFAQREGRVPSFDVITGTSVGAVHAAALAATAQEPGLGMQRLTQIWLDQQLSDVLRFSLRQATKLYRVWLGGSEAVGIFDPSRT